jgi:hypothetical protein
VGRDKDGKENTRLILTEQAIDEVIARISQLDGSVVSQKARTCLTRLQASKAFESDLHRGLSVPNPEAGYRIISCAANEGGEKTVETVGLIARNPTEKTKITFANAGIVTCSKTKPLRQRQNPL